MNWIEHLECHRNLRNGDDLKASIRQNEQWTQK